MTCCERTVLVLTAIMAALGPGANQATIGRILGTLEQIPDRCTTCELVVQNIQPGDDDGIPSISYLVDARNYLAGEVAELLEGMG